MEHSEDLIFSAQIEIIDINPYVPLPDEVLQAIFEQANKSKGPIPVKGSINGFPFIQTLVKFRGEWRLYLNTPMRNGSNTKVGDIATFNLSFDFVPRKIEINPNFKVALDENPDAKEIFDGLRPSLQKELIVYINLLKTRASVDRNIENAVQFLLGKRRFIGRDKP